MVKNKSYEQSSGTITLAGNVTNWEESNNHSKDEAIEKGYLPGSVPATKPDEPSEEEIETAAKQLLGR